MKRIYITFLISLFTLGIHAKEHCKSNDNLYLNIGAGFLVGDNGQPSAISNIAVAWDANIGYWFGTSKYAGIRIGYTGDILQSFNYIGNKSYGWNTLYVDGLLNLSNFICKFNRKSYQVGTANNRMFITITYRNCRYRNRLFYILGYSFCKLTY